MSVKCWPFQYMALWGILAYFQWCCDLLCKALKIQIAFGFITVILPFGSLLGLDRNPGFDAGMMRLHRYDHLYKKYSGEWGRYKELFRSYQRHSSKSEKSGYRIPKRIHMIWFGSEPPQFVQSMFESWKRYHPGWVVKLWTEQEARGYPMVNAEAFRRARNYGEKSDIFRYELLDREGGIYVDADFECVRSFDDLCRTCDFFTGMAYTDDRPFVYNGIIGSRPAHPIMKRVIANLSIGTGDNDFHRILNTTGPHHFSRCFAQVLWSSENVPSGCGTVVAFPLAYFYPFPDVERGDLSNREEIKRIWICPESYAIHYWKISWQ